jgi:hypothetical protein
LLGNLPDAAGRNHKCGARFAAAGQGHVSGGTARVQRESHAELAREGRDVSAMRGDVTQSELGCALCGQPERSAVEVHDRDLRVRHGGGDDEGRVPAATAEIHHVRPARSRW